MGYVLWDVVGCVVGVEGRVRGVDCVCAPLNRRVHQSTKWAQRGVQRWLALWRRTRPCRR